jgi:hypothetical protein
MIKLIDILNEVKIIPSGMARLLPKEDADLLSKIPMNSGEETYSSFEKFLETITYSCVENNNEDNRIICSVIKQLFKKYPKGAKFVSNDIYRGNRWYDLSFAPNTPSLDKYRNLIIIDPEKAKIEKSSPYVSIEDDDDNEYYMGWFDQIGNYHRDTKNFDDDGFYIRG